MPDFGEQQPDLVYEYKDNIAEKEKLENLLAEIKLEQDNRNKYVQNTERWIKKRFGIRPAVVTWPWRGASNLHLPLTDKTIRRAKPNFAGLIEGTYPTVSLESNVLGDDQLLIRGVERWFNKLIFGVDNMNVFLPLMWGIDLMLERGRFITKVIQEFTPYTKTEVIDINKLPAELKAFIFDPSTTNDMFAAELILRYKLDPENNDDLEQINRVIKDFRAGKDVLEFERQMNLTPFPSLYVRDPLTVLFPSDTTFFVSQARWAKDQVVLTIDDIERREAESIWNKPNTQELLSRLKEKSRNRYGQRVEPKSEEGPQEIERDREGLGTNYIGGEPISEIYFFKKFEGKRLAERAVLTIHPDHPDLPLRLIRYPYETVDGKQEDWPFDQVQFEMVGERAYAPRGYPQILDSLQTEITNNHNAKQNWMTIANTLNLKVKRNANINTHWIPGQPLYVNRQDDVQELNIAQRDLSFDNEERILKNWAEEYIGILDQTLTNQSGTPERRTKAEIDAVSALQVQVSSLDVRVFQSCMQRVYQRIWNRVMQYGPEDIEFTSASGDIMRVNKLDIRRRLSPVPIGSLHNSNKLLRSARTKEIYATVANDPLVDRYKLLKNWLVLEDERLAEDILIPPQQHQQNQIEKFIDDIDRINKGYTVIPRPEDDNQIALAVIEDFLRNPVKSRNFHRDRLIELDNFRKAHELALQKKNQASTRGARAMQEVAKVAQGISGREARK